jgi:hypothetical protein
MSKVAVGDVIEILPDPAPVGAADQTLVWEFDAGSGYVAFDNPLAPLYEVTDPGLLRITETLAGPAGSVSRQLVLTLVATQQTEAPVLVGAPVIAGTATVGQTLSLVTPAVFTGIPVPELTLRWQRRTAGNWVDIAGGTAGTYVLTEADRGAELAISVVADNGEGASAEARSNVIGPVQAAGVGLPALPATLTAFDFGEVARAVIVENAVDQWEDTNRWGANTRWAATVATRRPRLVQVHGRHALEFGSWDGSARFIQYPNRFFERGNEAANLLFDSGLSAPWCHSISFVPTGVGGVQYVIAASTSATSGRLFMLGINASNRLFLNLRRADSSDTSNAAGWTDIGTPLGHVCENGVPVAVTLRKAEGGGVTAFVNAHAVGVSCFSGSLADSGRPGQIRLGSATSAPTASTVFNGYVMDLVSDFAGDLPDAACVARNAALLSRIKPG